ncbi:MAG: CYTH domain-containing protein [Candidatus Thorarchaeota archaeon]|nr:MAG: CYTH domain-containing protein [Candidatus Thorarchaeota archaeon]
MKEIERKFIVKNDGWKKCVLLKKLNVKQGYISKSVQHQFRVRTTNDSASLTIKGPKKGLTRDEFEYAIPLNDAAELLKMSVTPIISKTRHYVRDEAQQVWEVDVYKGTNRGLVVAEIELANEKQSVKPPTWIGKEVSHDKRYTNSYIAEHKVPTK